MKLSSRKFVVLGVITASALLLPLFVTPTRAAEPSLIQILQNLGFTNIVQSSVQTFSAGTYNATLLAEFAAFHEGNELSYYELGDPNVFNVIFMGPEGNSGYADPQVDKSFVAANEFGFSLITPESHRYFTENNRNEYGIQHAKVYENLDDPGMYMIGFENQYGWWGDRDFNDIVFSIKPCEATVEYYLAVETDPASVVAIPGEGWYNSCTYVNLTAPDFVPASGFRHRFDYWDVDGTPQASNPITVHIDANHTATAHYVTQYYLTMGTNFGTISPGNGWHDAGSIVSVSATSPSTISGERYVWNGWTGTGIGSYSGMNNPASITVNGPITQTASWTRQYYLAVTSPYDTPGGEGWYDSGSTAYATLNTGTVDHGNETRRTFTSWSGDATGTNYAQSGSITMDGPKNAIANWKTRYYLTLTSSLGGVTNPSISEWYDAGVTVQVTAIPDLYYLFDHWGLNGMDVGSANPHNLLMDGAHTLHAVFDQEMSTLTITASTGGTTEPAPSSYVYPAGTYVAVTAIPDVNYVFDHWEFDGANVGCENPYNVFLNPDHTLLGVFVYLPPNHYLTIRTNPSSVVAISGEGWYTDGQNVVLTAPDTVTVSPGVRCEFTHWDVDGTTQGVGANPIAVIMTANHTATAHYVVQYYLTSTSPYGSPTPASGWFNAGTSITALVTSPAAGVTGTRFVCTGWTGTGSVLPSGTAGSVTFEINAPSTVAWNWKTQHYLTVKTNPSGIASISGGGWYDESANVPLTAPLVGGHDFTHWDVDGASQGADVISISVTVNAPCTATAYYQEQSTVVGGYTVSIESSAFHTWISINAALVATIFLMTSWMKRRRRK